MTDDPLATEEPDAPDPDVLALALLRLRAEGHHDAADALAAKYGGGGAVGKSCGGMSSAVGSAGGFLVPPAAFGAKRRRRKRRARQVVKAIIRDVEGE